MIDVNVSIDRATKRKMERVISDFAKATNQTAEDGIRRIAVLGARQLATKVQPYGITGEARKLLHGAAAAQSHRAISNANVEGIQGDAASVHLRARKGGRVPRDISTRGRFKRSPISFAERNQHVDKQVKKVGRAKAAWIEAGESTGEKITVQKWLRQNIGGGYGSATTRGKGIEYTVTLNNKTPYIRKIQFPQDVAAAVVAAMKNSFKGMITSTQKAIEKANRSL